jgi:hypothetical protein
MYNTLSNVLTEQEVLDACDKVEDKDLEAFNTRLIMCETTENTVIDETLIYIHILPKLGKNNYFGKRANGEKKYLGTVKEKGIYDPANNLIAQYVSSIDTLHYYNTNCMFAGVLGELYSQMPQKIKEDTKTYYISFNNNIGFYNCMHIIKVHFYEKL